MAVNKGDATGSPVITGGEINELPLRGIIRPPIHAGAPFAVVNAVTAFVQKHHGQGRTRIKDLAGTFVLQPTHAPQAGIIRIGSVEPTQHGNAPLPWKRKPGVGAGRGDTRKLIVARASP